MDDEIGVSLHLIALLYSCIQQQTDRKVLWSRYSQAQGSF